jgi:hypothetical protein
MITAIIITAQGNYAISGDERQIATWAEGRVRQSFTEDDDPIQIILKGPDEATRRAYAYMNDVFQELQYEAQVERLTKLLMRIT